MRSIDLRRLRSHRPHAEPVRPGAAALLRARGTARRTARAVTSPAVAPVLGLVSRAGLAVPPAAPARRERRARA